MKQVRNNIWNGWSLCLPFLILTISILVGCRKEEQTVDKEAERLRDSLALHVGVLPIWDCLPVLYAEETGIADSLGLDMRVTVFDALMDLDTAAVSGQLQVFWEDSLRLTHLSHDSVRPRMMIPTPTRLWLIANSTKRVRRATSLKEHMTATIRWSAVDEWLTGVIDSAKVVQTDVHRPQVNDVSLRCRMLRDALVDCAVLPYPYSQWAIMEGNVTLSQGSVRNVGFYTHEAAQKDSTRNHQLELFRQVYDIAREQIHEGRNTAVLRHILKERCHFTPELADTIQIE